MIGAVQDITDRAQVEEALNTTQREWEQMFNSTPDLIAIIDEHHRIVRTNHTMENRLLSLGFDPNNRESCFHCVHGTTEPIAACPHALTLQDGQEHTVEIHEERLGGDFIISTTPIKGAGGRVTGSVHVAREITQLRQLEIALREARQQLGNRV